MRRSQAPQAIGIGECTAGEVVSRGRAGQSNTQGHCRGKLVSPVHRRAAVKTLEGSFSVSERRACKVIGQNSSTQRYKARDRRDEELLVAAIHRLVNSPPRRGYRFFTACLKRGGWRVNDKRVHLIWKQEGFKVLRKQRKKRAVGTFSNACDKRATYRNDVWRWDFIHDRMVNGRQLKFLVIIDEYTRENLCLEVGYFFTADDVINILSGLMAVNGVPTHIRSDNGPEFIAKHMRKWLSQAQVNVLYVEPGAPWQNGYAESFNSRLRDEFLEMHYFMTLKEAQYKTAAWKRYYNEERPHASLGYHTKKFAESCLAG